VDWHRRNQLWSRTTHPPDCSPDSSAAPRRDHHADPDEQRAGTAARSCRPPAPPRSTSTPLCRPRAAASRPVEHVALVPTTEQQRSALSAFAGPMRRLPVQCGADGAW
jgi:hypothetical protein